MSQNALIYFLKAPELGRVKTRLACSIGAEAATTLYRLMCEQLLRITPPYNTDVIIAYDDDLRASLPSYLDGKRLFYQQGITLGERMKNAFVELFSQGYTRAILVGSDIPQLDERILKEAFELLVSNDAVLSPSLDGGYYLIGFHAHTFCNEAFENIVYSTDNVYTQTRLKMPHLRVAKTDMLGDIDVLEDLNAFTCKEIRTPLMQYVRDLLNALPRISIIIPVYHEDETLLRTIEQVRTMAETKCYEMIVVDTHDRTTVDALHVKDVRFGFSSKGRSAQMNEGARIASGQILLFLHADTLLPKGWDRLIEDALQQSKAGAFSLGIDDAHYALRFIEIMANLRTSWTQIPYGDQAHFFQASFFKERGGYAKMALMEDVEMMKRIKQEGEKIALLKHKVLTSSRRWHKEGIIYTTLRNRVLSFLYSCGVSPEQLAKRYKPHQN